MDFFGDFCLVCDGQTNGTDYCSQTCQLAGLDQYGTSEPASPIYCDTKTIARRPAGPVNAGLYLPPAIDFSVYRASTTTTASASAPARTGPRLSQGQISEQARNNLRDYAGSFDQTRTLRRRVSMQSNEDEKSQTS